MQAAAGEIRQFLNDLFGAKDDRWYVLIWQLEGKTSYWFQDLAAAAHFVEQHSQESLYVGVAPSHADHGPSQRLKIAGNERPPAAILALWADLDIADGVHVKSDRLPPNEDGARSILFPDPMRPSLLIHSGGGLQAWWIFREPWELQNEGEVQRASNLSARWGRALRARAQARGWTLDGVADLTRVLRVPGTVNLKIPGRPRPVRILERTDCRYNPSDLTEYLDMIGAAEVASVTTSSEGEIEYSPDAQPPLDRFQALCDNDLKFKASWDHQRKDLSDQSASSYDMALADTAVQAGWTDQEVVNLLISHRRRYSQELKLRDSYYRITLSKARAQFRTREAIAELETIVRQAGAPPARGEAGEAQVPSPAAPTAVQPDPDQIRAKTCDNLSEVFGVRIVRITKYLAEPAQYRMDTDSRSILLGGIRNLICQEAFRYQLADLAGKVIQPFKPAKWREISQAMLNACIEMTTGEEGTDEGIVRSWVLGYLEDRTVHESIEEADSDRLPFWHEGLIHLYMQSLRRWVMRTYGDRAAPKQLGVTLRSIGVEPSVVAIGRSTRHVYRLPPEFAERRVPKKI